MDGVIYLDSSDDEDEPVRGEEAQVVKCKQEPGVEHPNGGAIIPQVQAQQAQPQQVQVQQVQVQQVQAQQVQVQQVQDSGALVPRNHAQMRHHERPASSSPPEDGASLCRQFWQAGNYEDHPSKRRRTTQGAMDHVRVHPKFLHSNATSHKWALGAIAELLDNSIDEVVNGASFCFVDKITNPRDGGAALLIQDDGGGMTPDALRQCMSLGFSEKNGGTTIGQYGNGFKTSTMRLGADVIVLTRNESESGLVTQSAGLLSYTFLRKTGHEDIVVPMVDYNLQGTGVRPTALLQSNMDDWLSNLATITRWSPFVSEDELLEHFSNIGKHGTKVIIFNLWRDDNDDLELDFDTDPHDIKLRDNVKENEKSRKTSFQTSLVEQHISNRYRLSLRVYSSILYLEMPANFRIILRGKIVQHHNIVDDLKYVQYLKYKPHFGKEKESTHRDVSVVTTVGFTKEAPMVNVHGYSVYHRNRLIMPFWKVFHENSSRGRGVVGVLEVNFIEPAHDKQDFERTAVFIKLETRLKQITMEYWKAHCQLLGYKPAGVRTIQQGPKAINNANPTSQPSAVPQLESTEALTPEVPTSSSPASPPAMNNQESHPASTSASGPSTPDGNKVEKAKAKAGAETHDLEEILAEIRVTNSSDQVMPLANREPSTSMTISPENSGLLAEILDQNTVLRERCTDFEMREKEHLAKIAELEKELLALKRVHSLTPDVPQDGQLLLHNNVKTEAS